MTGDEKSLTVESVPVSKINPAPYNPRKDLQPGDPEYERLKRSLEQWDVVEPLVWNRRSGNLVGGHQRLKILIERGDSAVEVSVVDLDEQDEAALNVALNKISGDWDIPKLADVLSTLDAEGFDATLTGFDASELKGLLTAEPPDLDSTDDASDAVMRFAVFVSADKESEFRAAVRGLTVDVIGCDDENCDVSIRKLDANAWIERRSKLGKAPVSESDDSDGDT